MTVWLVAHTPSGTGGPAHHDNLVLAVDTSTLLDDIRLVLSLVTVGSTMLLSLFVAAPMIYFVVNSTTASTL